MSEDYTYLGILLEVNRPDGSYRSYQGRLDGLDIDRVMGIVQLKGTNPDLGKLLADLSEFDNASATIYWEAGDQGGFWSLRNLSVIEVEFEMGNHPWTITLLADIAPVGLSERPPLGWA